ncbi:hypothetical protein [Gloeobacter violaceus]|uniref:Gll3319 protein n=1 Tax=Gloeobacter violaceus (strain ATCC 29082 / PCC 7421) TaxID=251221 RepID=Q7NG54_GLOVI|nr:hypothetical protein [Gloeobacter violaceus]BAC91260.1 gll3319 [Gloeobacter violaceus PCC 7421]
MDQKEGAGHHKITEEATRKLFGTRDTIDGMGQQEYFQQLDEGQEHADRSPISSPLDWGETWKPHWMAEDAQREHSMADPNLSPEQNLQAIRSFVGGQLNNAHAAHSASRDFAALDGDGDGHLTSTEIKSGMGDKKLAESAAYLSRELGNLEELSNDELGDENDGFTQKDLQKAEMRSLGAATHALEDSYSSAHMFRDTTDPSDPHARVEGINVFNPLDEETTTGAADGAAVGALFGGLAGALVGAVAGGLIGVGQDEDMGTHDHRFDEVPVDEEGRLARASDLAAAAASAEMLSTYYEHRDDDDAAAHQAFADNVASFYQASDQGVSVFEDNDDPAWQQERDERLNATNNVADYDWVGGTCEEEASPTASEVPDSGQYESWEPEQEICE